MVNVKPVQLGKNTRMSFARIDEVLSLIHIFGATSLVYDDKVAKVSIVGAGMESHPGIAAMMFEALYESNINIRMISTSEIKISVLIDIDDADRAVTAIHDKFFTPDVVGQ